MVSSTRKRGSDTRLTPARVAALYVAVGLAWILGSDAALALLVGAPLEPLVVGQSVKGATFIIVSGALLYLLVRRLDAGSKSELRRYRTLFEAHPDPMWIYDPDSLRILEVNDAAVEHYGYSREEFLNMTLEDYRPTEDVSLFRASLGGLDGAQHHPTRWRHLRKDGSVLYADVASHGVDLGDIRGRLIVARDMTAQEEATTALAASEARARASSQHLQALIEAAPLGILTLDLDGIPVTWNAMATELFEFDHDRVHFPLAASADGRETLQQAAGGEVVHDHELHLTEAGRTRTLLVSLAPLRDVKGGVDALLAVVADVSERTELEAQLRHSQKMEALGRLAGGVAHDFNNLLTAILGYAELALEATPSDDERHGELREVLRAGERASLLVDHLLAFSRRQHRKPEILDLVEVVRSFERLLERLIGEDVTLEITTRSGPVPVVADRGQLEQVVMNLAVNSRDAMPRGGRLRINVDLAKGGGADTVELAVSDDGDGMAPEVAERAFEPFFTTKPPGKGTGLGLSTVYGIVIESGGTMDLESEEGVGTTVTLRLPRATAVPRRSAEPRPKPLTSGSGTILVIEDHEAVRGLVRRLLDDAGYEVLTAADGSEATEVLERNWASIDVVLSDVVLPDTTGPEIAEQVHATYPQVPFLFMSGYADDDRLPKSRDGDSVMLLSKPFTRQELLEAIEVVFLNKQERSARQAFSADGV